MNLLVNRVLLGCGLVYDDRKKALERFAQDWRIGRNVTELLHALRDD